MANTAPKAVFLQNFSMLLVFKNSVENLLTYSIPPSVSRRIGLRFEFWTICENASSFDCAFLFFKEILQPKLLKLTKATSSYLKPLLFLGPWSFMSNESESHVSPIDLIVVLFHNSF